MRSALAVPRCSRKRGATLLEVIVAMTVFSLGLLGVIQAQVLVARQNGISRRQSRAAAILRDFVEAAQRWEFNDPRLDTPGGCSAPPAPSDLPHEEALGTDRAPARRFGFTATATAHASAEATVINALTRGGTVPYDGLAPSLLGDTERERFQLLWSVQNVELNTSVPGCEAKLVSVAVRYPLAAGSDVYRSLAISFIKHDTARMSAGGVSEVF